MEVPHPGGHTLIYHVVEQEWPHEVHATLDLCHVQVLPLARPAAVVQGCQNGQGIVTRGNEIGQVSQVCRFPVRPAGNMAEA